MFPSRNFPAGLLLAFVLGLSFALAGQGRATAPIYAVTNTLHSVDQPGNPVNAPLAATGLNAAGQVCGYYSQTTSSNAVNTVGFILPPGQAQVNLSQVLGTYNSLPTCQGEGGSVAGVCWYDGTHVGQQGFVWQNGSITTFTSPTGGDIDAVTAVNNQGQVVGTYFDGSISAYQRAFRWDGTTCTDLGDLGDPDDSFVWPVSLNDNGQVAGTLYTENLDGPPASSTAFQWQGGVMTTLDADGQFAGTTAAAQDVDGHVAGTFLTLATKKTPQPTGGGFFWSGDGVGDGPVDLGSLGGGGTVPFALTTGLVTGSSYAGDGTLHLFNWQEGASALSDLGAAQLEPGDQGFQLTGVSSDGSVVGGFVTDAGGACHAVISQAGAVWDLATLVPAYQAFVPDPSNGQGLFVNASGRAVCSSFDADGLPVLLVLDVQPDTDGDGLPDAWELRYFHHKGVDPDADADGDGETNLQEYEQGTDPTDFYDGQSPFLSVVGGDGQRGAPGSYLPVPLSVQANAGHAGATLTFSVTAGTALLATSNGGATSPSVQVTGNAAFTLPDGTTTSVAQVYVYLPAAASGGTGNSLSTITATATPKGGAAAGTVSASAIASNPNLTPPGAPTIVHGTDTTADLAWTPSDLSLVTLIEVSVDGGTTWQSVGTVAAGVTAATVYQLRPYQPVLLRVSTVGYTPPGGGGGTSSTANGGGQPADAGSGSTAPSGATADTPLGSPVVVSSGQTADGYAYGFLGYAPGSTNFYLQDELSGDWEETDYGKYYSGHYDWIRLNTTPTQPGGFTSTIIGDFGNTDASHPSAFQVDSDTQRHEDYDYLGLGTQSSGHASNVQETLSDLYDKATFVQAVEATLAPDGNGEYEGGFYGYISLVVGELEEEYNITIPSYQFRCNPDPNGQIYYDIQFTPDGGGPVVHDVHTLPTNGATLVPDQPIVLDVHSLNHDQNGTYSVVVLDLTPDDAEAVAQADGDVQASNSGAQPSAGSSPPPSPASLVPDPAQQTGVRGALVDSYLLTHPPANPAANAPPAQKHFVSPKAANDWVDIAATPFDDGDKWQVTKDDPALPDPPDLTQYVLQVPRDVAGRYTLSVLTPAPGSTKDNPIYTAKPGMPTLSVWIVWADGHAVQTPAGSFKNAKGTSFAGVASQGVLFSASPTPKDPNSGFVFEFTIQPASIIGSNSAADVPDIQGAYNPQGAAPPPGANPINGGLYANGATSAWDATQSVRTEIINPGVAHGDLPLATSSHFWDQEPATAVASDLTIQDFPTATQDPHGVWGTDDTTATDENDDPYQAFSSGLLTCIYHAQGTVRETDLPQIAILSNSVVSGSGAPRLYAQENANFVVDERFAAFLRVQLGGQWYRASDHLNWHFKLDALYQSGLWTDHGSSCGLSASTD